jgi:hypothetical protein
VFFENVSEEPVTFYLYDQLAEITLRDGRRTLGRCRVPAGIASQQPDERRFITLAPAQRIGTFVDLRFTCYGAALGRLERASTISVTYRARFARDRDGNPTWTGRLGPVELLLPAATPGLPTDVTSVTEESRVTLHPLSRTIDTDRGTSVPVALELRGPHRGRVPLAVRPESFAFEVVPPSGDTIRCQLPPTGVRPLREFYDLLGRYRTRLDIAAICPEGTFDRSGVYEVTPIFFSSYVGLEVDLQAWTGEVIGGSFLVRVRRGGTRWSDPVERVVPSSTIEGWVDDESR